MAGQFLQPVGKACASAGAKEVLDEVHQLHQGLVAPLEQHRQMVAAVQAELRQAAGQPPEQTAPTAQPLNDCDADTAQLDAPAVESQQADSCDADSAEAVTGAETGGADVEAATEVTRTAEGSEVQGGSRVPRKRKRDVHNDEEGGFRQDVTFRVCLTVQNLGTELYPLKTQPASIRG